MAGVFDFGTRFGEGYMAGSQLAAQREARKAQQMNSDRDFALRESQAVLENERAALQAEMARQGLGLQERSLGFQVQNAAAQRGFQSGEREKDRTLQREQFNMQDKRVRRGQDLDRLKAIQGMLALDPGNEDLKQQAIEIIGRMRSEDGANPLSAGPLKAPTLSTPPPPAQAVPPTGLRLDMQDNPATRVGLRPYSGPAVMAGLGQAAVRTGAQAGGAVTEFMDTMPTTPQPSREPGPGRMLPARALDAGALIPGQGPSIPGGFVGPPLQSPGVLNQAYRWLERAATPTPPQAQQPMPSLAPVSGTSTSSAAMRLPDEGGIAALPDVPGTHGNRPKQYAGKILKMAKEIAPGSAPPEFEQAAKEAETSTGIPANLLLSLAAAESAYEANAVSPTGAKGPFQFIRSTGQQYGLVGDGFDDRSDVRKSAQAAAQYLKDLSAQFNGDIGLALMAYNQGPDAVRKAMSQQ